MNLKKLFLLCSLVFTTMAFAQQTINGSVKDSKGKPVTGATVLVVGTSRSATTNSDGGYSIKAQAEETLQFAAQGYQNVQKKVGLETTIDVVLPLASEENTRCKCCWIYGYYFGRRGRPQRKNSRTYSYLLRGNARF